MLLLKITAVPLSSALVCFGLAKANQDHSKQRLYEESHRMLHYSWKCKQAVRLK